MPKSKAGTIDWMPAETGNRYKIESGIFRGQSAPGEGKTAAGKTSVRGAERLWRILDKKGNNRS